VRCSLATFASAAVAWAILYFPYPAGGGSVKSLQSANWNAAVIRISIQWMINLVETMGHLKEVRADDRVLERATQLFHAKTLLEGLFVQSIYSPYLRVSREKANPLWRTLNDFLDTAASDSGRTLSADEA
jgi:hypothetical protein